MSFLKDALGVINKPLDKMENMTDKIGFIRTLKDKLPGEIGNKISGNPLKDASGMFDEVKRETGLNKALQNLPLGLDKISGNPLEDAGNLSEIGKAIPGFNTINKIGGPLNINDLKNPNGRLDALKDIGAMGSDFSGKDYLDGTQNKVKNLFGNQGSVQEDDIKRQTRYELLKNLLGR